MGAYRIGQLAGIMLFMVGALFSCARSSNMVSARATVVTIDRTCIFIAQDDRHSRSEEDCNATPEFRSIADSGNRSKRVDGKAVIHVVFPSPKDGSTVAADLHFTGREDEFYDLKAGDTVAIRVDRNDPTKIRAA